MNNKNVSNYSATHPQRVLFLDGLRGLAILMVILYHAFARWPDIVPYQNQFGEFLLFKHGKLGVQLFFIISGFVILMTLENCRSFGDFMFRRWLRLFPAMLICSIIIFVMAKLFVDRPFGQPVLRDLIPGLLFVEPELISRTFNIKQSVLEGSFWSLFVEIKFYIVAGSMYFILGKKKMIFTIIGLFLISLAYEKLHRLVILPQSIDTVIRLSSIQHFGWFAVGALFYEYYIKNSKVYLMAAVVLAILVARHYDRFQSESMVMKLLLILTFVLPLLGNRTVTKILQHKLLMFLGFISYPLYLLHETMMVSMIIKLGVYCPWIPNILLPILPILIVIFLAYIVAQYAEPLLRNTIRHIVKTLQTLKPSAA